MIERVIQTALSRRLVIAAIALGLLALGTWSWTVLQKEAYPDVGDTQVTVITEFAGRAAEEVENQVTLPLERGLNSVPRVLSRRSKTIFGLSVVYLTFEEGVDDYWARQRVLEKLPEIELPEGVRSELAPLTGPVGEILRYVVEGTDEHTPMALREIQDWVIIPKLLQVPGVADVITFGGLVKQFHVITSPDKLAKYDLSLSDVIDTISRNNLSTGGNVIRRGEQGLVVRGIGSIRGKKDIENIVATTAHGVPIYIKDFATIEAFPMPPSGILGYSSREEFKGEVEHNDSAVQGLIAMRRGENASEVVDLLKAKVQEINSAGDLPEGVQLRVTYDRGELVNYTIRTVSHTLFEGISIVVIILVFFIGSLRSALVVATTIPLSLLFAFIMMKITAIPANLLSLGAIDFGIIVDGAVVMVENILRRYRIAGEDGYKVGIIPCTFDAAREVSREIFFSIAIIIAAYLPIFTFQRVEGKLFSPMACTLAFAILGSMVLALTLVPVLMTWIYRKHFQPSENSEPKPLEWHNPVYHWLEERYAKVVQWSVIRYTRVVGLCFTGVLAVIVLGGMRIGTEFLPQLDEGAVNVRCFFPVGISLQEAQRYTRPIREALMEFSPVKLVITQLGRNEDGTDPYNPNRLEILVGLHDYNLWKSELPKPQLMSEIKSKLDNLIPGATFSFSQPILDNVTEAVTGSVADLAILINGQDLKEMRAKASEILQVIKQIPGASEYGIEQEGDQAQLVVDVKRDEIARYGINVADVQRMIEAAIGGKSIGTAYENGRRFDIVVRYGWKYRASVEAVRNMPIRSQTGAKIPLRQLASIRLIDGPTIVQRQEGKRQISVRTNIRGRDQGSFVAEAQKLVAEKVEVPKNMTLSWGGQFENLSRAGNQLKLVVPFTFLLIFVILFTLYKDAWLVAIAFSCIPFSLAGGLVALLLRGYNLNVSAGVGFISLFGIATMSGVLFVSRMKHLREDNPKVPLDTLVKKAAAIQLRPWLTTILPALFGLIPACLASGIGSDVQRPLATVIVGGLTSGLALTLLALPSLYLYVDGLRVRMGSLKMMKNLGATSALVLFSLLLSGTPAHAATEPEIKREKISLEDAEQRFLRNNYQVLASKLEIEAAQGAVIQAGIWANPTFTIEQNIYNPQTKKYFDFSPRGNTDWQLQQLFSIAGKYSNQTKVAERNKEATEQSFFNTLRGLKLELRKAFFGIHYQEKLLSFYDRSIASLSQTVSTIQKLADKRMVLATEPMRIRSLLLSFQTERLSIATALQQRKSDLRIFLGEPPETPLEFVPVVDEKKIDSIQVDLTLNEILEAAKKSRPDLKMAETAIKSEEANVSLQKSLAYPDLGLGVSYSRAGSYIPEYYALSLSLEIPIFDRNQGNISQARMTLDKNRQLKEHMSQILEKEVRVSYFKAKEIESQFRQVDRGLASSYESLIDKMLENYRKQNIGIIALADFLESCRDSVSQVRGLETSRIEAFEEMNYAVGTDLIKIKTKE